MALISVLFLFTSSFFIISEAIKAQHYAHEYYASKQDPLKMNFLDSGESILEYLSFGYIGNVSEEKLTREMNLSKSQDHSNRAFSFLYLCISLSILSLCIVYFKTSKTDYTLYVTGGFHSLFLLLGAISCPMLEINYIYGESAPLHISKSIIDTTLSIYQSGPIALAFILFSCSVLIPALKSIDLCLFAFRGQHLILSFSKLCKLLSKWSMADVFVVAILIAFFVPTGIKTNEDGYAESFLKPGFYFFLYYCLLTIFLNQLASNSKPLEK